ncbi:MAG: CYTH domain-containing protein [Motiliproteus sp.]|nr:CYTH domain-containing protein [Motiliproteus sp.]MCW9053754.1 CYTH domain-containing protein [Motiliproteus sp.]
MAQEIELKLSLPSSDQQQLRDHPLLDQLSCGEVRQWDLDNTYFDTPGQALNKHRIALRIRRQGERFIQTLKTKGTSSGGLHQRHEWEWDLDQPQLQPSLLPVEAFPADIDVEQLQPAFNTNFQRTAWQLTMSDGDQSAHIELVLDLGSARSGFSQRQDPISEVELELKGGEPRLIYLLALELAKTIPLRITQVSKGERGYRLDAPLQVPDFPSAHANQSALQRLMELLECCQSLIECYEFEPQPEPLCKLLQAMEEVQALLEVGTVRLPNNIHERYQHSCQQLRLLLSPWLLSEGISTENNDQNLAKINRLLASLPLSQSLLQLSYSCFLRQTESAA